MIAPTPMNLMMLTPNTDSTNQPLFGQETRPRSAVGPNREINDREIAQTSSIAEAAKIVSKRMADTLATELRKVTDVEEYAM